MSNQQEGSGPSGPGPSTLKDGILNRLRSIGPGDSYQVAADTGAPQPSVSTLFTQLYDQGLVEPMDKRGSRDRLRYRIVPDDRIEEVKRAALNRRRPALLRGIQKLPRGTQAWLMEQMMHVSGDVALDDKLCAEECPGKDDERLCTCTNNSMYIIRHHRRSRNPTRARLRNLARDRRQEQRQHAQELKEASRAGDNHLVEMLNTKQYARDAVYFVHHIAAILEEERDDRRDTGYGIITDEELRTLREIVNDIGPGLKEAEGHLRWMLDGEEDDDGVVDAEAVDEEMLELEAEVVDDD